MKTLEVNNEISNLFFNTTWMENGIPICTQPEFQAKPQICSDGLDGIIVIWHDSRFGYGTDDIYGQRLDSNGNLHWTIDGKLIISADDMQRYPKICRTRDGSIIIAWHDYRNEENNGIDIYTQKIDPNGVIQWDSNDIPICTVGEHQWTPEICCDGLGGAIITWDDDRHGNDLYGIYAQRVNSNGEVQWTPNGTAICTGKGRYLDVRICSDGNNGAIIVWNDERQEINKRDIYAQRIDNDGNIKWITNGTHISSALSDKRNLEICSDGNGGAIITWRDEKIEDQYEIYAQKIDTYGNLQWGDNGTLVYKCNRGMAHPEICTDGEGGAIITWDDNHVYIQKINSTGEILWGENGIYVYSGDEPRIISDKNGGAIIGFVRGEVTQRDIYIQHIDAHGNLLWTDTALPLCTADYRQDRPAMYCDGKGNAFFAWEDNRVNVHNNYDIYAQCIKYEVPLNQDQAIPIGNFYILMIFVGIISLVIIYKRRILYRQQSR